MRNLTKGEEPQMTELVDSTQYGLPKSTIIEKIGKDHFAILISRKSRIIMKDGVTLLAKADQIKTREPNASVSLKTSTPLCSKTRKFLEEHDIRIIPA
jgi:hypothetical protein